MSLGLRVDYYNFRMLPSEGSFSKTHSCVRAFTSAPFLTKQLRTERRPNLTATHKGVDLPYRDIVALPSMSALYFKRLIS